MDSFEVGERLRKGSIIEAPQQCSRSQLLFDPRRRRAIKLCDLNKVSQRLSKYPSDALQGRKRRRVLAALDIGDSGRSPLDRFRQRLLAEACAPTRPPYLAPYRTLQVGTSRPEVSFQALAWTRKRAIFFCVKLEANFATGCKRAKPPARAHRTGS